MANLNNLRTKALNQLKLIYNTLSKLDGTVDELAEAINQCVEFLLDFRDALPGVQTTPTASASNVEGPQISEDAFRFIPLLNRRPELLSALGITDRWSAQTDDAYKADLLINAVNDNRVKRVHDALRHKCRKTPNSACGVEDEAWPLFEWLIEAVSLTLPPSKKPTFEYYDGKRFDGNTMYATTQVVAGKVTRTRIPGVPQLRIKGVVDVVSG